MTRTRLIRLGLSTCDLALVAGVLFIPLFAWKGIRVVEFGMLPLLALPWTWRRMRFSWRDWLLLALFGQYALLVALNYFFLPPLEGVENDRAEDITLYLGSGLLLYLMLLRVRQAGDLAHFWRVLAPTLLIGSVLLLFWQHMTTPPPDNCRVDLLAKHLLIPPLWLGALTVASYSLWRQLSPAERWLRHVTVFAVLAALSGLMGARAGVIALLVALPPLALLLGAGAPIGERVRIVAQIGVVSVLGLAAGLALDMRAQCGFTERLVAIGTTALNLGSAEEATRERFTERLDNGPAAGPETAPPPDTRLTAPEAAPVKAPQLAESATSENRLVAGVYIRPLLWQAGLERFREAPILGWGAANEEALVPGDFPHFHMQYLSWMIWGGVVLLGSGIVMLAAPVFAFGVRQSQEAAVLALAMVGPTAIYLLSETWLLHTTTVLSYPIVLALFHAMSQPNTRGAVTPAAATPEPERGGTR